MYIYKAKIFNYKSFLESEEIEFGKGFNVIVGENNAGKTALLEALKPYFEHHPHRSLITIPSPDSVPTPLSKVELKIKISKEEFLVLTENTAKLSNGFFSIRISEAISNQQYLDTVDNFINDTPEEFLISFNTSQNNNTLPNIEEINIDSSSSFMSMYFDFNLRKITFKDKFSSNSSKPTYQTLDLFIFLKKVYFFKSERLNISASSFGANDILNSNASNLAEVLNILQGNTYRFNRFNQYISTIFPQIKQITVRPNKNNTQQVEILAWTIDPANERYDLAIPLSECGTGVGQVLAILYVAITSKESQVIIIDESQSFLHPRAIRSLFSILKEFSQHQYIVSTHSPTVISAANPNTIHIVRKINNESHIESYKTNDIETMKACLYEVGANLADVFGADNILWVEGQTEEACYPILLEYNENILSKSTVILSIKHTGDFDEKNKMKVKTTFDIYHRLSTGQALLPPAIAFIFDKEKRTEKEQTDLKRQAEQSNTKVYFLKKTMYENYLLNTDAIAFVMNEIDGFSEQKITPQQVSDWLKNAKNNTTVYETMWQGNILGEYDNLHGKRLLQGMFYDLSKDNAVKYEVIGHGKKLTRWIAENSPDDMQELVDLLASII